ncbi:bacillithiol biosynthesis cysteine-adding enzyme BshC [Flavobacterium endophyticum]|uniref:Putative cysteine ligase BshC n=1 Tax=Flavobacterium endophyticum TaxID=1540163 RepID=A0A495MK79_9FLAO|nr:bacillithiol biosynthesis cysteine-adding enzyme BshC [Flavobacterium endophyticum]RKS25442.1 bacillithiol biosynthesis cysteine-adding enzyme BshC [Flavobacterium endophyticum]
MPTDCISYQESGYFTSLINDYLNQKPDVQSLYHRFPTLENFEKQLLEKEKNFNSSDNLKRKTLVSALEKQYSKLNVSDLTKLNIQALGSSKTFTITTGHQLNLFTGPLYFLYKIVSTINLTKQLKLKYPEYNFVPVYWMATEDHDFEEINYFNLHGKKVRWNTESGGPVGRLSTQGLEEVFEIFSLELGIGKNAEYLKKLFHESYVNHTNLADATRFLANELFGKTGLVILDADTPELKKIFIPHAKEELLKQTSYQKVMETSEKLKDYNIQVNPREINLFYIEDDFRERIILQNGYYYINNRELKFTQSEIVQLLENHPEKFSPNVIMRPLYQEVILPNLCYIGGGGELAYWLELKSYFEASDVTFPILLLRNSVLLATEKLAKKADKLNLTWKDLFSKQQDLMNAKVKTFSEFPIDFTEQKAFLRKQFDDLNEMANQTDKSFIGAVKAQEVKQIKGLDNLEKRLLKAEKKKHQEELERIADLQNELFPNKSLQERIVNFSEFYLGYGDVLLDKLFEELNPLEQEFKVVVL